MLQPEAKKDNVSGNAPNRRTYHIEQVPESDKLLFGFYVH